MSNNKVSFWNSIIIRFAILFTLLVILCVLISGYLAFNQASSIILEHGKENISHDAQLAKQSFYNLLKEVSNDIAVVTNNPTVELYITDATPFNTEQTDKLAEVLLSNKPEYFQLRILDVNDGNEIIRFNKSNDSITKTPEDQLQNKGDKEYFTNAISRPEIAYYFSEINLNEEFGKVSSPITPTL